MRQFLISVGALLLLATPALAVDMAATFGTGNPLTTLASDGFCGLQAVHNGVTTTNAVGLTANGTDSATIQLNCQGNVVTASVNHLTVNGSDRGTVSFPQTVTSSGPGEWEISFEGSHGIFTIFAQ